MKTIESERINAMLKTWNKDGVAYSKIGNNDDTFILKCGFTYLQIGINSTTGNNVKYTKPFAQTS